MNCKSSIITLLISLLILAFFSNSFSQYYGFEKRTAYYKLKDLEKDSSLFKKLLPGYKVIKYKDSVIDSSDVSLIKTTIYSRHKDIPLNIGAFKSVLVCENYFKAPNKKISFISPIISNADYNHFIKYVTDSIAHVLLGNAYNPEYLGDHYRVDRDGMVIKYGFEHPYRLINWDEDIEWDNPEVQYILEDSNYGIFIPENERFYHKKEIDTRKLAFSNNRLCFSCLSLQAEGENYLEILKAIDSSGHYYYNNFIRCINNVFPDTLFWITEVENIDLNFRIALSKYYHNNNYFKSFPAMGMEISAIEGFMAYKAIYHNQLIENNNPRLLPKQIPEIIYRLPDLSEIINTTEQEIIISLDTNLLYENFQITEYEYLEFIKYVADSIAHVLLGNEDNSEELGYHYRVDRDGIVILYGFENPYKLIDWDEDIEWSKIEIQETLRILKILDAENTIITRILNFKYYDIKWDELINDPAVFRDKSLLNLNNCYNDSIINVFPDNKLGEFFKENYGKTDFKKLDMDKFKAKIIKDITYEQAYAFYMWRNEKIHTPKNSNPLNYFTIPSKEQWLKVSNNEPIHLPSELIISNQCSILDKNKTIKEFQFRLVMDVYFEDQ